MPRVMALLFWRSPKSVFCIPTRMRRAAPPSFFYRHFSRSWHHSRTFRAHSAALAFLIPFLAFLAPFPSSSAAAHATFLRQRVRGAQRRSCFLYSISRAPGTIPHTPCALAARRAARHVQYHPDDPSPAFFKSQLCGGGAANRPFTVLPSDRRFAPPSHFLFDFWSSRGCHRASTARSAAETLPQWPHPPRLCTFNVFLRAPAVSSTRNTAHAIFGVPASGSSHSPHVRSAEHRSIALSTSPPSIGRALLPLTSLQRIALPFYFYSIFRRPAAGSSVSQ
ncbi:hypothetical protein C8J57DRAFT_1580271 [Mycena rebaudengoi]|nr:hypothetical protein C8J57DRAFT_1533726 [Mycena rebaudengoi]KAJ7231947.1 hypothetical protein C8J57DRAFT_1580271 [Mycena rebaudengoi]